MRVVRKLMAVCGPRSRFREKIMFRRTRGDRQQVLSVFFHYESFKMLLELRKTKMKR